MIITLDLPSQQQRMQGINHLCVLELLLTLPFPLIKVHIAQISFERSYIYLQVGKRDAGTVIRFQKIYGVFGQLDAVWVFLLFESCLDLGKRGDTCFCTPRMMLMLDCLGEVYIKVINIFLNKFRWLFLDWSIIIIGILYAI